MKNDEATIKNVAKILQGRNGQFEMIGFSVVAIISGIGFVFSGEKNIFSFGLIILGLPVLTYSIYAAVKDRNTLFKLLADTVYESGDFNQVTEFYKESKNTMCVTAEERIAWALEKLEKFKARNISAE